MKIAIDDLENAITFSCPDCSHEVSLEIAGVNRQKEIIFLAYCTHCKTQLRYRASNIKDELMPRIVARESKLIM